MLRVLPNVSEVPVVRATEVELEAELGAAGEASGQIDARNSEIIPSER